MNNKKFKVLGSLFIILAIIVFGYAVYAAYTRLINPIVQLDLSRLYLELFTNLTLFLILLFPGLFFIRMGRHNLETTNLIKFSYKVLFLALITYIMGLLIYLTIFLPGEQGHPPFAIFYVFFWVPALILNVMAVILLFVNSMVNRKTRIT